MKSLQKLSEKEINFLKELDDNSVVFTSEYATITIPDEWFDKKIAELQGRNVKCFGLLSINVYETEDPNDDKDGPDEYFFLFKSCIYMTPSQIVESRNKDGEKQWVLIFNKGSAFINNTVMVKDKTVATKMLSFMTLGYFPNVLPYEDIAQYWSDVSAYNGIALSAMSQSSIEVVVSEICRDPKDLSRPFRYKIRENPQVNRFIWKMINMKYLPKYNSVFSSLTSGDPRGNLISIISRQRNGSGQRTSPIEEAIL